MGLFEREIRFIYDFNLNRVKKVGSYLTFEQLVSAELHPAILQYISAEIDFLIFEDRQKLLKESVFDYSGKNISELFNQIDDEIKKTKKFSIEYINKILLHSTSFIVNYLIRPRWTLSQFLFDNQVEKSASEIKQILNYVYFYDYLKDTLISYLDKKRIVSITKNDLEVLLAKVDKLGVETYLPTILDTSVKSISEVFNIGSVQTDKFPIYAIELFLMEKELHTHYQKLKELFPGDPRPKVSISDIKNILLDIEHTDLAVDPYMPEETIEEDSLSQTNTPEFEELPDQYVGDSSEIENDSTVETNSGIDPNTFISQNFAEIESAKSEESVDNKELEVDDDLEEEVGEDSTKEKLVEEDEAEIVIPQQEEAVTEQLADQTEDSANSLDEKLEEIQAEVEQKENEQIDLEKNFLHENKEEGEKEDIIEENDDVSEVIESEVISDTVNDLEEKKDETTITINYPAGYEAPDKPEIIKTNDEQLENSEEIIENLIAENKSTITEEEHSDSGDITEALDNIFDTQTNEEEISVNVPEEENIEAAIEDTIDELIVEEENVSSDSESEFISENNLAHLNNILEIKGADDEQENETVDFKEINKDEEIESEDKGELEPLEEEESTSTDPEEPELFPFFENEEENKSSVLDEVIVQDEIKEDEKVEPSARIDISELLENKNMTKIIKVIFDYDMEDFANTIEQISECMVKEEADVILDKLYKANRVKPSSKEATAFNLIIAEYFGSEG